jgi:hypothetical protein
MRNGNILTFCPVLLEEHAVLWCLNLVSVSGTTVSQISTATRFMVPHVCKWFLVDGDASRLAHVVVKICQSAVHKCGAHADRGAMKRIIW